MFYAVGDIYLFIYNLLTKNWTNISLAEQCIRCPMGGRRRKSTYTLCCAVELSRGRSIPCALDIAEALRLVRLYTFACGCVLYYFLVFFSLQSNHHLKEVKWVVSFSWERHNRGIAAVPLLSGGLFSLLSRGRSIPCVLDVAEAPRLVRLNIFVYRCAVFLVFCFFFSLQSSASVCVCVCMCVCCVFYFYFFTSLCRWAARVFCTSRFTRQRFPLIFNDIVADFAVVRVQVQQKLAAISR